MPGYNNVRNKKGGESSEKRVLSSKQFLHFVFSAAKPESNVPQSIPMSIITIRNQNQLKDFSGKPAGG